MMRWLPVLGLLPGCFAPLTGAWTSNYEVTQAGCADDTHTRHAVEIGADGRYALDKDLGRTYVMSLHDAPELPLTCYLAGRDFHCAGDTRSVIEGRDATVVTTVTAGGRFSAADAATGTLSVTVGCEGGYCFGMGLNGCQVEKTFQSAAATPPL